MHVVVTKKEIENLGGGTGVKGITQHQISAISGEKCKGGDWKGGGGGGGAGSKAKKILSTIRGYTGFWNQAASRKPQSGGVQARDNERGGKNEKRKTTEKDCSKLTNKKALETTKGEKAKVGTSEESKLP